MVQSRVKEMYDSITLGDLSRSREIYLSRGISQLGCTPNCQIVVNSLTMLRLLIKRTLKNCMNIELYNGQVTGKYQKVLGKWSPLLNEMRYVH